MPKLEIGIGKHATVMNIHYYKVVIIEKFKNSFAIYTIKKV